MLKERRFDAVAAAAVGRHLAGLALCVVISGALATCSDETADARKSNRPLPTASHQVEWLELGHHMTMTPAQWLVSRREATLRAADDPEVQRVAERLTKAIAVYRESERMIANRAAQLSDMLASLGIDESAASILDDMIGIANDVAMTEGFGSVAHHYYNLRATQVPREEALKDLKSRYGGKRS